LQFLASVAADRFALPLLRCYWYEATVEGRRSSEHDALADLPGVKLRLAKMRPGRREGVESEIHRDVTTLARNKAISDALVVSAEEDLASVIGDVQDLGVRVLMAHITVDGNWTISRSLRQECDDIVEVTSSHLRPYVELIAGAEPVRTDEPESDPLATVRQQSNGHAPGMYPPAAAQQQLPAIYTAPAVTEYQRIAPAALSRSAVEELAPAAQPMMPSTIRGRVDGLGDEPRGYRDERQQVAPGGRVTDEPRDPLPARAETPSRETLSARPELPVRAEQPSARQEPPARQDQDIYGAPVPGYSAGGVRDRANGNGQQFGAGRSGYTGPQPVTPSFTAAPSFTAGPGFPGAPSAVPQPAPTALSQPPSAAPPAPPVVQSPSIAPAQSGPQPISQQSQSRSISAIPPAAQGQAAIQAPASQLPATQTATSTQTGTAQSPASMSLADAVQAAHEEGMDFGSSVARDAPALWLEAVLARKPRMPSDLEARLLQGSALPIDFLLHDEVRHALRRGFWDALERARR
jgi:hypothetical protein